jgi:hypothetical protein
MALEELAIQTSVVELRALDRIAQTAKTKTEACGKQQQNGARDKHHAEAGQQQAQEGAVG